MKNSGSLYLFKNVCLVATLICFSAVSYAKDDKQLAEELNQKWDQTFNQSDAKGLAALYGENAVISPGNGTVLKGAEAIQNLFQSFFDNGVHSHKIEVLEVHRNGNTLYQVSNWQASGQAKDGVTPTFGGVVTLISTLNEQGEWQLQVHSWNMKN